MAIDRDPDEFDYSVAQVVCCADDGLRHRAKAISRSAETCGRTGWPGARRRSSTPLGTWAEAGVERTYLQVLDRADLEHVALLGEEVRPNLT